MREIKFRAWDKQNEKMLYFENRWFINSEYDDLTFSCEDCKGTVLYGDNKRYVLMQYTELVDRNRRQIWEADIVDLPVLKDGLDIWHGESETHVIKIRAVVEWFSAGFVFTYPAHHTHLSSSCGVVGNLYENPELRRREK